MKQLIYTHITDDDYLGIITMLDYETSLRHSLMDLSVAINGYEKRKVIVDLALKTGINKYRFASYSVNDDGKVLLNSSKYISPCDRIVKFANSIIRQHPEILSNSMLPKAEQHELISH